MTATAPTSYHHGNLRKSLIEAALLHLQTQSTDTLSLRALARQVGVSQTAPYRHFKDKKALLEELATLGFNRLSERMEAAINLYPLDYPRQILAIGVSYIRFAIDEPALFFLIFGPKTRDKKDNKVLSEAGKRCFRVLLNTIVTGIDAGVLKQEPPLHMANAAWATAHGLASLVVHGHDNPEQSGSLVDEMEASLTLLVKGLVKENIAVEPLDDR
ncbi:TetR/AcrR family transcriptional regulator [Motiliproteus sp. MSK22-1]|uniref:TetR/AcrR family transcriptional regulator n=1 Tax=Motiliproteus sp. MSK22-1 TaxID=1897630 RepID=UPI000975A2F7|nr:TetR/AcrR family transcriptional regulator [Motiliproteus sp. MSK22-1]OMH32813.1 hypothetical protein BGP75_14935 [Motiliproteus sp. MSK22-1]